jgi:hypothetical protein
MIGYGHGQNGDLGDTSVLALDSTSSLIECGQICVQITWVGSTAWHLLTGGRDLSEGISISTHISHDDQHVELPLVGQILGSGEGQSGSDNSLNSGIVGEVEEQHDTLHGTVLLEVGLEETGYLHVDTHSCEHHTEVLFAVVVDVLALDEGGLTHDLGTDLVVGQTVG